MTARTITCTRCKVPVEEDKLDLPNRCNDPKCPLNNRGKS
jgi:DNA-directed RNA polymerase subunit RPC12/RpoP